MDEDIEGKIWIKAFQLSVESREEEAVNLVLMAKFDASKDSVLLVATARVVEILNGDGDRKVNEIIDESILFATSLLNVNLGNEDKDGMASIMRETFKYDGKIS